MAGARGTANKSGGNVQARESVGVISSRVLLLLLRLLLRSRVHHGASALHHGEGVPGANGVLLGALEPALVAALHLDQVQVAVGHGGGNQLVAAALITVSGTGQHLVLRGWAGEGMAQSGAESAVWQGVVWCVLHSATGARAAQLGCTG